MTVLHIDMLYLNTRVQFDTEIIVQNNKGSTLGKLTNLFPKSSKKQRGFYVFEKIVNGRKYATSIPISGEEETSLLIFQILPDSGKKHFLCEINIMYNPIRFERGVFTSELTEHHGYGIFLLAHKSFYTKIIQNSTQFVNWRLALSLLIKDSEKRKVLSLEDPEKIVDKWHLSFYRSMLELVNESFDMGKSKSVS